MIGACRMTSGTQYRYCVVVRRVMASGAGKMEMVTPIDGWRGNFDGPYVNHT